VSGDKTRLSTKINVVMVAVRHKSVVRKLSLVLQCEAAALVPVCCGGLDGNVSAAFWEDELTDLSFL